MNTGGVIQFGETDGVKPLRLFVTGKSHPRWKSESSVIDFGMIDISSDVPQRNVLVRTSEYGANARISHVKSYSHLLNAHLSPHAKEFSGTYLISIGLSANSPPGQFYERVDVFAAGQEKAAFAIYVTGDWCSAISVQPTRLLLTRSQSPMGTVYLRQKEGKAIRLLSTNVVDLDPDVIEVEAVNRGSIDSLQVNIDVLDANLTIYTGTLLLTLQVGNEQESRSIKIPFCYTGRQ